MAEGLLLGIRRAELSDLAAMEWEGEYRHLREVYRQAIREAQSGRRLVLVAEVDGRVVGQIFGQYTYTRDGPLAAPQAGYLYSFRVRPALQNQGIGSSLLMEAETALRARGRRRAVIAVAQDNLLARQLYQRRGYRVFAEDPDAWTYRNDRGLMQSISEPAYLMVKTL
jgi:ribosomal protein S18 acetylase RimI-like enzyme